MRETRSYGSARGVRSNPYPYRDTPTPDAEGGAKTLSPGTQLVSTRAPRNLTPDRGNGTPTGSERRAADRGRGR
jgi:hypothetical protein